MNIYLRAFVRVAFIALIASALIYLAWLYWHVT